MTTAANAANTAPTPSVAATRIAVTLTGSVIAACAFTFSFGNIWNLALAWGIPAPIAPLVAPMLDISVVGLMIAIRQLALNGISGHRLLSARLLMLACAITTWGLNIAQAVTERRWGAVVIDSVAPALLLGWAEVGPTLLRLTNALPTIPTSELTNRSPSRGALAPVSIAVREARQPDDETEDFTQERNLPHVA